MRGAHYENLKEFEADVAKQMMVYDVSCLAYGNRRLAEILDSGH